ncbi:MAG TPA: ZIP family metal transporter, partial [Clostridia bacterium]|nr:ZIP family metal transporter [Clostridia bacterium]
MQTLIGLMIPFVGTTLGASMVVFLKKEMSDRVRKVLLGFASGVMIA